MKEILTSEVESCIRGHYHYRLNARTPRIGEFLLCSREPSNVYDQFTVRVYWRNGKTVGYLPREISRKCSTFLEQGGKISVEVTGHEEWGKGTEIPCLLKLYKSVPVEIGFQELTVPDTVVQTQDCHFAWTGDGIRYTVDAGVVKKALKEGLSERTVLHRDGVLDAWLKGWVNGWRDRVLADANVD